MRVLWIVNMVLPPLASKLNIKSGLSGTWMFDIAEKLDADSNVDFAVACVWGDKFRKVNVNNSVYYCLPGNGRDMMFYNKGFTKYWQQTVEDFKPDIVNIHGTEYCHALSFLRAFPNIKTVISLQGMMSKIQHYDFAGLTKKEILKYRTLREWLHFNGMLEYHIFHKKNAKTEQEMLKSVKYCMEVDDWHKSVAFEINPDLKFFNIHYNLRDEFYNAPKWDINNIERYTITANPGGTALKGLHQLFKAVAVVKQKYPKVSVKIPGMSADKKGHLIANTGYARYLKRLISDLKIEDNIKFLGPQTSEQMVDNMLHTHIQVIPSSIEGPSLVLHEGMHLGVPSIASFRGGMATFVNDSENGFLYDFGEYQMLALKIIQLFSNDDLALKLSHNAIQKAELEHDRDKNYQSYMNMYNSILND